ncbi:MAG: type II toxin-antitoxin system VapC family toxin, partial [Spirochaetaceae bacterium]|nr:type II toxin-antitoxin system VapC family toxin [Spirochaetaceae bacterium]
MTSYLVDTHILLWVLVDSEKLPVKVREIICNPSHEIYYSIASMWEVAIKYSKGKLPISGAMFLHYCEQAGFKKLPVDERHVLALENLTRQDGSPPHKDPFDKIMLAQAKADSMLFMTH